MGEVVSIMDGGHLGGWLPAPPFRLSPTLRIGFMFPMSLLNPRPHSFPFTSSRDASEALETPVGLKADRTPGWKLMLPNTDVPKPKRCPGWLLAEVTLMSRALSWSSTLLFLDLPSRNGDDVSARLFESDTEEEVRGDVDVLGMSPDLGDLLNVSEPLACCCCCSLLTKPLPLLSAQ